MEMKTVFQKHLTPWLALLVMGSLAGGACAVEAWTPESLTAAMKTLPAGDATRGADVHQKSGCGGCHGPQGVAMAGDFPHVAGQPVAVTEKFMLDYKTGRRNVGPQAMMMSMMGGNVNEQQIADLAAYYATLPLGKGAVAGAKLSTPKVDEGAILKLIKKGDATRGITPCAACHGSTPTGNPDGQVPVIHGQNPAYFKLTMQAYRKGDRSSDLLKEMRVFAQKLTDDEIEGLAYFYATHPGDEGVKTAPKP